MTQLVRSELNYHSDKKRLTKKAVRLESRTTSLFFQINIWGQEKSGVKVQEYLTLLPNNRPDKERSEHKDDLTLLQNNQSGQERSEVRVNEDLIKLQNSHSGREKSEVRVEEDLIFFSKLSVQLRKEVKVKEDLNLLQSNQSDHETLSQQKQNRRRQRTRRPQSPFKKEAYSPRKNEIKVTEDLTPV